MSETLDLYLRSLKTTDGAIKVHESVLKRYMLTLNGNTPNPDSAIHFLILNKAKGLSVLTLSVHKSILELFLSWCSSRKVRLDCPWITDAYREHMRQYYIFTRRKQGGKPIRLRGNKRTRPDGTCELCAESAKKLYYHHWDDDNTMKGMWLCRQCNLQTADLIEKKGIGGVLWLVERYVMLKTEIDLTYGQD